MVLDHIGIVVADLEEGCSRFAAEIQAEWASEVCQDPIQQVRVKFLKSADGIVYEMLSPTTETSPVFKVAKSGRGTLHHLAYRTNDLEHDAERWIEGGYVALGGPQKGVVYGDRRIQFFLAPAGVLMELIERPVHQFSWHEIQAP